MALTESRPLPDAFLGGSSLTLLENALWTYFSPGILDESAELSATRVVSRRAPILRTD